MTVLILATAPCWLPVLGWLVLSPLSAYWERHSHLQP